MADISLTEQDWQVRLYIYEFFVAKTCPPSVAETAQQFSVEADEAIISYQRLNAAHHIFLEPGTNTIRMANPLSAVPTDYRVQLDDRWVYANCAWDTLGIAAMCDSDAVIEATLPASHQKVTYRVLNGQLQAAEDLLVHFALPVRQWYDNLVHT
jgi:hypothetical protein